MFRLAPHTFFFHLNILFDLPGLCLLGRTVSGDVERKLLSFLEGLGVFDPSIVESLQH